MQARHKADDQDMGDDDDWYGHQSRSTKDDWSEVSSDRDDDPRDPEVGCCRSRTMVVALASVGCMVHFLLFITLVLFNKTLNKILNAQGMGGAGFADAAFELVAMAPAAALIVFAYIGYGVRLWILLATIVTLFVQAILLIIHVAVVVGLTREIMAPTLEEEKRVMSWVLAFIAMSCLCGYVCLYVFVGYAGFVYWSWLDNQHEDPYKPKKEDKKRPPSQERRRNRTSPPPPATQWRNRSNRTIGRGRRGRPRPRRWGSVAPRMRAGTPRMTHSGGGAVVAKRPPRSLR